jgi:hypothetical protein
MSNRKLPNPMSDLEGAFMLATQLLGIADPIARAFAGVRGQEDDEDSASPSPAPQAPSPRPPPRDSRSSKATEVVAEIVCDVCDNTKLVGRRGSEVMCPACAPLPSRASEKECETCGGEGRVGRANHKVKCPVC